MIGRPPTALATAATLCRSADASISNHGSKAGGTAAGRCGRGCVDGAAPPPVPTMRALAAPADVVMNSRREIFMLRSSGASRGKVRRRRYLCSMRSLRPVVFALLSASGLWAQVPDHLTSQEFATLSADLSERSGFFDTDNLISNEDSYLHAVTTVAKLGITGGAYLGVGPDQNFSYITAIRPRIAFIIDVRRDNLLELLLFKSIFGLSRNRLEYLCLLLGRAIPGDS